MASIELGLYLKKKKVSFTHVRFDEHRGAVYWSTMSNPPVGKILSCSTCKVRAKCGGALSCCHCSCTCSMIVSVRHVQIEW